MADAFPNFTDSDILAERMPRNVVDPRRPYAYLLETERSAEGELVGVATLFLSNSECPYRCLMCDLWKNTLPRSLPSAGIPEQIDFALQRLPAGRQIKLYNSGNFFDPKAIPEEQYPAIADRVRQFDRVVVENHPHLVGDRCLRFRDLIAPAQLEVALGLETCHPEILRTLNKRMTLSDYERATEFLRHEGIEMRTFILLRPPFLSEEEGVEWALKSVRYAFQQGVECCSLVPTRVGNGMMERLAEQGHFAPPSGRSIENVLQAGIEMQRGRVLMDLWDAEQFFQCERCRTLRIQRLRQMNLSQRVLPVVECVDCS